MNSSNFLTYEEWRLSESITEQSARFYAELIKIMWQDVALKTIQN